MFVSDRYGSESSPGWGAEGSNRRIPPWTVSSWRARRAGLPGWWGGGWRRPAGGRGRGRRRRGGTAPAGPTRRSPPSAWPGATCPCTRTRCLVWKKIQINSNLWNLGTLASDFFVSVLAMILNFKYSFWGKQVDFFQFNKLLRFYDFIYHPSSPFKKISGNYRYILGTEPVPYLPFDLLHIGTVPTVQNIGTLKNCTFNPKALKFYHEV